MADAPPPPNNPGGSNWLLLQQVTPSTNDGTVCPSELTLEGLIHMEMLQDSPGEDTGPDQPTNSDLHPLAGYYSENSQVPGYVSQQQQMTDVPHPSDYIDMQNSPYRGAFGPNSTFEEAANPQPRRQAMPQNTGANIQQIHGQGVHGQSIHAGAIHASAFHASAFHTGANGNPFFPMANSNQWTGTNHSTPAATANPYMMAPQVTGSTFGASPAPWTNMPIGHGPRTSLTGFMAQQTLALPNAQTAMTMGYPAPAPAPTSVPASAQMMPYHQPTMTPAHFNAGNTAMHNTMLGQPSFASLFPPVQQSANMFSSMHAPAPASMQAAPPTSMSFASVPSMDMFSPAAWTPSPTTSALAMPTALAVTAAGTQFPNMLGGNFLSTGPGWPANPSNMPYVNMFGNDGLLFPDDQLSSFINSTPIPNMFPGVPAAPSNMPLVTAIAPPSVPFATALFTHAPSGFTNMHTTAATTNAMMATAYAPVPTPAPAPTPSAAAQLNPMTNVNVMMQQGHWQAGPATVNNSTSSRGARGPQLVAYEYDFVDESRKRTNQAPAYEYNFDGAEDELEKDVKSSPSSPSLWSQKQLNSRKKLKMAEEPGAEDAQEETAAVNAAGAQLATSSTGMLGGVGAGNKPIAKSQRTGKGRKNGSSSQSGSSSSQSGSSSSQKQQKPQKQEPNPYPVAPHLH
ncbi:hypothetical protein SCUCBS95973_004783 [Sporothrix curviconia]|uniref:Uncharacterized protein n=1 Tax=Sporothrix curviconia TaxID=1260050 RepID=A0ABP0BT64_9PEZI